MIKIHYKQIERSALIENEICSRITKILEKFPRLGESDIHVHLYCENSPVKGGVDVYRIKLHLMSGVYGGIKVMKSHSNFYVALANLSDVMLERLNRFSDRVRVRERALARRLRKGLLESAS